MGQSPVWIRADIPDNLIRGLRDRLSLSRPMAMFMAARGISLDEAQKHIDAPLAGLSDPFRFPGMDKAVERIWRAIMNDETIIIHGDYDTDGVTATALVKSVLGDNGATVKAFLPHRFDDGYGLTPESLLKAIESVDGGKLMITVDCGITSHEAVAAARKRGVDVIVTDHHEPADKLPDALAVINPKVYPELADLNHLAGVGVAFKLCHAFVKYGREQKLGGFRTDLKEVLDLVTLGTVADIVPLVGENRIMVKHGLKVLERQLRPGVRALFETARVAKGLRPSDITFKLAPRINAAGRLGDADKALDLLRTNDIIEAYRFARDLDDYNRRRQSAEEDIFNQAQRQIDQKLDIENQRAIVVAGADWHQGVVGIVASRLSREYNRPTVVLSIQNGEAQGSGRAVGTVNMVEMLNECSDILTRYGGHPMAVGVSIKTENIEEFKFRFNQLAERKLSPTDLLGAINIDGQAEIHELDDEFFTSMERLAPFGHGHPTPIFEFKRLETVKVFQAGQNHSRGVVRDAYGHEFDFIAFNRHPDTLPGNHWDIAATPQINHFRGLNRPQLQIIDIKGGL